MWSQAHRYIFRQTALTLLCAAAAFTAVVWLVYSLRFLDLLGAGSVSPAVFAQLVLLNLPRFLAAAMPVALFVAIVLVFHRLAGDRELVALRAAGMSNPRLALAPAAVALLTAVAVASINLIVAPLAAQSFRSLNQLVRADLPLAGIRAGAFQSPHPGLTVFAAAVNGDGTLSGLLVHDTRRKDRSVTISARSALRVDRPDGAALLLGDGLLQERDPADGRLTTVRFDRYILTADSLTDAVATRRPDPSEMSLAMLLAGGAGWAPPGTAARMLAEGHARLAGILHAPAMAALALWLLLHPVPARQTPRLRLAATVAAALLLQAAILAARWAAARNPWLLGAMYLVPLVSIATAATLCLRDMDGRGHAAAAR